MDKRLVWIVALALIATGCTSGPGDGKKPCQKDAECEYYEFCSNSTHTCELQGGFCHNDGDCDSHRCDGHVCVWPQLENGSDMHIALIVDDSNSMAGEKMVKAKAAALRFIASENNRNALFGLYSFENTCVPRRLVDLTAERQAIREAINPLDAVGGTPIADALKQAYGYLDASNASQIPSSVILFSDGEESCGGDPCQVVKDRAGLSRLPIYTIGYMVDKKSEAQLQCIAHYSKGKYVPSPTEETLNDTFDEVRNALTQNCSSDIECRGNSVCEGGWCVESQLNTVYLPLGINADDAYRQEVERQHQFLVDSLPSLSNCTHRIKMTVINTPCVLPAYPDSDSMLRTAEACVTKATNREYDYFVAFANPADIIRAINLNGAVGYASPNFQTGIVSSIGYPVTTAHELGHKFGLWDEYCNCTVQSQNRCNAQPNPLSAADGCNPTDGSCCRAQPRFGYCDIICEGNNGMNGTQVTAGRSIMSYANAPDPRFHDRPSLDHLLTLPQLRCDG